MEQLLNTIAQFIQTYGVWFIVADVILFVFAVLVFILSFIVIAKAFTNIKKKQRK